jgi:hypothetical protein
MTIDWKRWMEPLRDAAIIMVLTTVGGFVLGFSGIKASPENATVYNVIVMFMGILGFTIIGSITKRKRIEYLPIVALIVWLINFANVAVGWLTFQDWIFSALGIAVWMLLGGALSYIFVRNSPASPKVESGRSE